MQSEKIDQIIPAFIKAKKAMGCGVETNKINPFFHSKYADLSAVLATIGDLGEFDLCFTQQFIPSENPKTVTLETVLYHSSGQWISSVLSTELMKNSPQDIGSAITYFRRYSLVSMFGLAQEDDDANSISKGNANVSQQSNAVRQCRPRSRS